MEPAGPLRHSQFGEESKEYFDILQMILTNCRLYGIDHYLVNAVC